MPLLQVVEVSAKPHGVVLEGRGAEALDRGARFGGDPVAQLRAEVVEGRAHPLPVCAARARPWGGGARARGARWGGDPVPELGAGGVEGRAPPLLVRAVGSGRWEGLRAVVVH